MKKTDVQIFWNSVKFFDFSFLKRIRQSKKVKIMHFFLKMNPEKLKK